MSHGSNKMIRCNHDGQTALNFEAGGIVGFKDFFKKKSGLRILIDMHFLEFWRIIPLPTMC